MAASEKDAQKRIESLQDKNKRLEKKVEVLSRQVAMMSKILNQGNLSTLQFLFDQICVFCNAQLKKIQPELLFTEHNANDAIALFQFREYLLSIYNQLGSYTVMTNGLINVDLRRIQDKHSEIGYALIRINGVSHETMQEILDEQDRLCEHILQILEQQEEDSP